MGWRRTVVTRVWPSAGRDSTIQYHPVERDVVLLPKASPRTWKERERERERDGERERETERERQRQTDRHGEGEGGEREGGEREGGRGSPSLGI